MHRRWCLLEYLRVWTNNCARGRWWTPTSQPARAPLRRGRSLPLMDLQSNILLIPSLASDGRWPRRLRTCCLCHQAIDVLVAFDPDFLYYSALSSRIIASCLHLFFLSRTSDSFLQGNSLWAKYREACDVTISSVSFWGSMKSGFSLFLGGIQTPRAAFHFTISNMFCQIDLFPSV